MKHYLTRAGCKKAKKKTGNCKKASIIWAGGMRQHASETRHEITLSDLEMNGVGHMYLFKLVSFVLGPIAAPPASPRLRPQVSPPLSPFIKLENHKNPAEYHFVHNVNHPALKVGNNTGSTSFF